MSNSMDSKEERSGTMSAVSKPVNGAFVLDSNKLADFLAKKANSSSDVIKRFEKMTTGKIDKVAPDGNK